ncbi:hypothetical protein JTE90_029089 [Oedothorax gibbosus]|uniref:Protein DP71L n=1 Tax=Oedothorax gibbosus TaxID=931172 RepID=A0AAV6V6K8_9ARAC|nr:hypothetical protein JTE90_029089 [Oedothorax gibbosus]
MSLNIVDSLLDKLSFTSKEINIPFGKKFTGSQNFLGTNQCLSQSIPAEFLTPFKMDNDFFSVDHTKMYRSHSLDSKMNNYLHYFDPTSDRLVGRVSKLLSPMLSSHGSFCLAQNCLEILRDQEFMKQGFKLLCEEVEQHFGKMNKKQSDKKTCSGINNSNSAESSPTKASPENLISVPIKVGHQTCSPSAEISTNQIKEPNPLVNFKKDMPLQTSLTVSVEITTSPNSVLKSDKNVCHQPNMSAESTIKSKMTVAHVATREDTKKPLINNNQTLNEELTNRKNKEVQKRSKKRRRRQKKNSQKKDAKDTTRATPNTAHAGPSNSPTDKTQATPNTAHAVRSNSPTDKNSDIFCDIVRNGVQILLPNSLVISIESATEDDSDWDTNTDCDWLNDCSEFGVSGIFISNLSSPLSCFSQLSVPSGPSEDIEMCRLSKVLRRVNEDWVKSMKGLDTKPKVATKVSFAPDDELVEIVHVEVFDRKGEWEIFATERMRFKRRIDELEKIISPCLSVKHREKILSRLQKSD